MERADALKDKLHSRHQFKVLHNGLAFLPRRALFGTGERCGSLPGPGLRHKHCCAIHRPYRHFCPFPPPGLNAMQAAPPPCICSFPLRTAKWGMGKPPPPTRPQMCFLGPLLKIPRGSIFRIFTAIFASKSLPAEGKRIGPKETNDFWQWTKILLQKLPSLTPEKPLQNPQ